MEHSRTHLHVVHEGRLPFCCLPKSIIGERLEEAGYDEIDVSLDLCLLPKRAKVVDRKLLPPERRSPVALPPFDPPVEDITIRMSTMRASRSTLLTA